MASPIDRAAARPAPGVYCAAELAALERQARRRRIARAVWRAVVIAAVVVVAAAI